MKSLTAFFHFIFQYSFYKVPSEDFLLYYMPQKFCSAEKWYFCTDETTDHIFLF